MYFVFKFSGTWSIYDKIKLVSRLLQPQEIELIKTLFPAALRDNAILDALLVKAFSASNLQDLVLDELPSGNTAYYVCGFSGTWSLFDKTKGNSRLLLPKEVELIKTLFSAAFKEGAVLDALILTPISANKLQQLTSEESIVKVTNKITGTLQRQTVN